MADDSFLTIRTEARATYKELSSKFLAYAFPVTTEEEVKEHLDALRKEFFDATHHCYAYRLGPKGENWRANDDGEPSSTAGKPIHGQLLSHSLTDCLIVVVRYFGGTKLGVPGLIKAYKESAQAVIEQADIYEKTVDRTFRVAFSYLSMNDVMKVIKECSPEIHSQEFDNLCTMTLSQRCSRAEILLEKLRKVEGAQVEEIF